MNAFVRPARDTDKEPLMAFIKHVWSGHDYIPRVWDEWLRDSGGRVFVAEVDGKPAGMNRVRFLGDGSGWFEGVRVHPDYRGKGLASQLGENSMKVAANRGVEVFRLTSGSRNKSAHRQIAKMRFREAARFTLYSPAQGRPSKSEGVSRMKRGREGDALRMMQSTREFKLGTGVYWHDFAAAALTSGTVARLLDEGAVWSKGRAVAVVKRGGEGKRVWEQISFVGGPPEEATRLIRSLVGRLKGAEERWVFLPQRSPIIRSLRRAGFRRHYSLVLFERRAAKG